MSAHTPGPWDASPWSSVVGGGVFAQPDKTKNQVLIAQVRSAHADTLLMAAAPALLAACEAMLAEHSKPSRRFVGTPARTAARAAIAKARGGK